MILRNKKNTIQMNSTPVTEEIADDYSKQISNGTERLDITDHLNINQTRSFVPQQQFNITDLRLSRIEMILRSMCTELNLSSNDYFCKNFIRNDYNEQGWIHAYSYGSPIVHCGFNGNVVDENKHRVIFETIFDQKPVTMAVFKSDINRSGNYQIFETNETNNSTKKSP